MAVAMAASSPRWISLLWASLVWLRSREREDRGSASGAVIDVCTRTRTVDSRQIWPGLSVLVVSGIWHPEADHPRNSRLEARKRLRGSHASCDLRSVEATTNCNLAGGSTSDHNSALGRATVPPWTGWTIPHVVECDPRVPHNSFELRFQSGRKYGHRHQMVRWQGAAKLEPACSAHSPLCQSPSTRAHALPSSGSCRCRYYVRFLMVAAARRVVREPSTTDMSAWLPMS